jgi:phosphate starvation-inducible PhoH-like protein
VSEITIDLKGIDPVEFLGAQNSKLSLLKKAFPDLEISSRGNQVTIKGNQEDVKLLKERIDLMLQYLEKFGFLSNNIMQGLLADPGEMEDLITSYTNDVIVRGPGGVTVKAQTPNQQKMVQLAEDNDIVFAAGPAGTGKTYTAVAMAVKALQQKEVKRIILTRPAVEAGESLGFLPGDIREKVDPYLRPLYDALDDMLPPEKVQYYIDNRVIEIAPLAFMRGRTLDKAFVILDEAQNATLRQLKMFLTRLGPKAKSIVTGDLTQVDLPHNQKSGMSTAIDLLEDVEGIGVVHLTDKDVIRHELVGKIIRRFEKYENQKSSKSKKKKRKRKRKNKKRKKKNNRSPKKSAQKKQSKQKGKQESS